MESPTKCGTSLSAPQPTHPIHSTPALTPPAVPNALLSRDYSHQFRPVHVILSMLLSNFREFEKRDAKILLTCARFFSSASLSYWLLVDYLASCALLIGQFLCFYDLQNLWILPPRHTTLPLDLLLGIRYGCSPEARLDGLPCQMRHHL